jgi:glycosyltransferase involved in cell wall biosynthesis
VNPPLASIVVPCRNAEQWLGRTLESALAQTLPDREILLVDDGSTDRSLEVARGFASRGVQVVSQPNRGASAARNHGLRLARGRFIKFLDADDLLAPEALALQVAALEGRPEAIAFGPWARFQEDATNAIFTPHPGWQDSPALDWIKATWADTEPMYQCGLFLLPRPLLDRAGGWDESLSLIDDFEFFTRVALQAKELIFTPGARLYYRSGLTASLSGRKSRRAWESACRSSLLAVEHLLAREDSATTRRLGANILQKLVYAFYPEHPDLRRDLALRISRLGGADIPPGGGASFQRLARVVGWRFAARLRYWLGRRPA